MTYSLRVLRALQALLALNSMTLMDRSVPSAEVVKAIRSLVTSDL